MQRSQRRVFPIVHLKLIDETAGGYVKAALCGNGREPDVEGVLDASPAEVHEVLLNLRRGRGPGNITRSCGKGRGESARNRGVADDAVFPAVRSPARAASVNRG